MYANKASLFLNKLNPVDYKTQKVEFKLKIIKMLNA